MIKIGNEIKDSKLGSKQVVRICQGIDAIWELKKENLVYSGTGQSSYDFIVNSWNKLNPNKNYKFVTNRADNEYSVVVGGMYYTIKNYDVFRITKNCDIKIKNIDYNYYDIKIYEVDEKATIVI